jgi:hypothetical protein
MTIWWFMDADKKGNMKAYSLSRTANNHYQCLHNYFSILTTFKMSELLVHSETFKINVRIMATTDYYPA